MKECFGSVLDRMESGETGECNRCELLQRCMEKAVREAEEGASGERTASR
jgi:hypothetical protein